MKSVLIKLLAGLALAYSGWYFFDKGTDSPSDKTLSNYERLCKTSVKTTGVFDSTYTETHFKVLKGAGSTTLNTFSYTYTADGQTYKGSFSTKGVPDKNTVDVWYDPVNKQEHLTGDPCKQYEFSKARKYPDWYTYAGIPMLLIGAVLLYGLFKTGMRTLTGRNKQPVKS